MVGRVGVVLCALVALPFATSAPARADEQWGSCAFVAGPTSYQARLAPLITAADAAAQAAIGAQYTRLWLDTGHQGWSIGFAPGPLDADGVRAAIVAKLQSSLPVEEADYLAQNLWTSAQPYSEAELHAVQGQVVAFLAGAHYVSWGVGILCVDGAIRVEADVYTGDDEPTQAQRDEVAAAFAPFGDKLRYEVTKGAIVPVSGTSGGPAPAVTPPATAAVPPPATAAVPPRVAAYTTLPRTSRCVHGRAITVKARKADGLKTLAVAARGHRTTLAPGRAARVRLAAHGATKVAVTVTLTSGATASQTYRFTRC